MSHTLPFNRLVTFYDTPPVHKVSLFYNAPETTNGTAQCPLLTAVVAVEHTKWGGSREEPGERSPVLGPKGAKFQQGAWDGVPRS